MNVKKRNLIETQCLLLSHTANNKQMKTAHLILFCLVFLLGLLLSQVDNIFLNLGGFVFIFKPMVQNLVFSLMLFCSILFAIPNFVLRLVAFKVTKIKREEVHFMSLINYPAFLNFSTSSPDLLKTT